MWNHLLNQLISPGSQTPPPPMTILIVDDEEPIRKFVSRVLTEAGHTTAVACSGADALQVAENMPTLEVLVTDLMMPEMAGDEVARRLRRSRPALKVLYFTGYSDRLFEEKATLWADEAFIEKPCSRKGLLEAVTFLGAQ